MVGSNDCSPDGASAYVEAKVIDMKRKLVMTMAFMHPPTS